MRRRCLGVPVKPVATAGTTVAQPGRNGSKPWVWPAWCTATGGPVLPAGAKPNLARCRRDCSSN
jgi:hypothetical protein